MSTPWPQMVKQHRDTIAAATELLPDGFVSANGRAELGHLNKRAEHITGLDAADVLGRDIREALVLQDSTGVSWWEVADPFHGLNIRTGHREKLLLLANGREVLVTAKYLREVHLGPVTRVVLALRDTEARHRVEASHALLISTLAHELRSPLTSVKGFSSTLLRRWDRFSDDQKRLMIETIEVDADRVTRLITELLDVSRIDAGRIQLRTQPVDIKAALERHVERHVASGVDRDRFVVDVAGDLPELWADPDRLDQILGNLIENAIKHGEGLVRLAAHRARGPHDPAKHPVDLLVADDGAGIPQENRTIVFTKFWHGNARGSSGLGLYVVKGLVEAHGGHIVAEDVEDGQGRGVQFRFSLPSGAPEHIG